MHFWRLRYTHLVDDGEYDREQQPEDIFFENLEEAMAYILDIREKQYVRDIHLTKFCTAIRKTKHILNDDNKKE